MSLLQYIQGFRKGKEAHRLEREAMQDSFLADALEGYNKVKGNHLPEIEKLRKQISLKTKAQQTFYWRYWSMAASILIIVSIGSYFIFHQPDLQNEPVLAEQIVPIEMEEQQASEPENTKVPEKELLAQNKETVQFTPPVIVKDEEVATEIVQAEAQVPDALSFVETTSVSKVSTKKENFDDYVKKALLHPADDECKDVKGNVTLRFFVDKNGRPYDITVKKSLCPSADKEAIRLVEEGPDWALTDKEVTKKISF
ncbi:hypothetical protein FACS189421_06230 [Bacteroidia bacterium]|nr:hypothetical protein FACS189421_06230 [Bacteroidia bacterium]GHT03404.1 hypothetical protein FACS189423_04240 [Bacteroidia bacterium]GHT45140.1 hypothetical protein FACS189440_00550 [Bacteroidia bacterium]